MRLAYCCIAVFSITLQPSFAQKPCTHTIPVTVVLEDGTNVTKLPPDALTTKSSAVLLKPDFAPDESPRRVLIVLDGSADLQRDVVKAEKWMATTLVRNARPRDAFAMISGNSVPTRIRFGDGNAVVANALETFEIDSSRKRLGLLDTIKEASAWFGTPQFGDTVVLFAGPSLESPRPTAHDLSRPRHTEDSPWIPADNDTDLETLTSSLISRGIRVFGVSLGSEISSMRYLGVNRFGNLTSLSFDTGGAWYTNYRMAEGRADDYKFNDEAKAALKTEVMKMRDAIALPYRVSAQTTGSKETPARLELRPEISHKLPPSLVLHPRVLEPCSKK